jgi:hypothetical protein
LPSLECNSLNIRSILGFLGDRNLLIPFAIVDVCCREQIVAFLPLPALSRFRVVSKKYNAWIFSQEFIKLCAQLPVERITSLDGLQGKIGSLISTNFKVRAGANLFGSAHEGMLPYFGPEWKQYMRAASGDLLFVECTKPPADETGPELYEMICDFSAMTCVRLPQPVVLPERWYGYSFVMLGRCSSRRRRRR